MFKYLDKFRDFILKYPGWFAIAGAVLVASALLGRAYIRVGSSEVDRLTGEINVNIEGGVGARVNLYAEDSKPLIFSQEAYPVINLSGKDSVIEIDGRAYSLWDGRMNYCTKYDRAEQNLKSCLDEGASVPIGKLDNPRKAIFISYSFGDADKQGAFILEQVVRLVARDQVRITFMMIPTKDVYTPTDKIYKEVKLRLAYYGENLIQVEQNGSSVHSVDPGAARRWPNTTTPFQYVPFELTNGINPVAFDNNKVSSRLDNYRGFWLTFAASNPPYDKRTTIVDQTFTVKPAIPQK
jgi:hypothetical protein